jgi:hypothetical protein
VTGALLSRLADRFEQRVNPKPNETLRRFPTPGELARFVRNDTVQTSMLDKFDEAIVLADSGEHRRWIINCPPQEGKSTRAQAAALWLLLRDPSRRIAFASYEQGLARVSGLAVRQYLETHGSGYLGARRDLDREDVLGLALDPVRGEASAWALAKTPTTPLPGGVISVGVGSGFTGRPADVLFIDDPIKDAQAADSSKIRQNVIDWYLAVASTRLSSDAIVIVVQTRWHEQDLAGWLEAEDDPDEPVWRKLAVAAEAMKEDPEAQPPIGPDPLGRKPGEFMVSARGRTAEDWEKIKKAQGRGTSRWWFAMYQQRPAAPAGGVFQREWFRRDRLTERPLMRRTLVMVDPADNEGDGDEAGIVVGGVCADGRYAVLADWTAHYTIDQWFRRAYFAFFEFDASAVCWEASLSGLRRSAASTWKRLREEARALVAAWKHVYGPDAVFPEHDREPRAAVLVVACDALAREEDDRQDAMTQRQKLVQLWPYVRAIRAAPRTGPPLKSIQAKGSKTQRAEFVAPLYDNREVSHVGHLAQLEHEMSTWQVTQKSPNRMDALVHLLTELSRSDGGTMQRATGPDLPRHTGVRQAQQVPTSSVGSRGWR